MLQKSAEDVSEVKEAAPWTLHEEGQGRFVGDFNGWG